MLIPAALLLQLALANSDVSPEELRAGDLLLHTSRSAQAEAISVATGSPYTHVGVVVRDGGELWVVEAQARARKTKLVDYLRRAASPSWVMRDHRLDDEELRERVQRASLSLLGTPYDPSFSEGSDALYCSELVVEAWSRAGLAIGVADRVGALDLDAPAVRALFAKRWRRHPSCRDAPNVSACRAIVIEQRVVTPAGLARDGNLLELGRIERP